MDKKLEAKMASLKKLSGKSRDESNKGIGEALKSKKLKKVTVASPTEEGLKKGLSLAEKLMQAKFGEQEEEDSEELDHECEGEDCPYCKEMEEESDEE
jgi:hypothetical protein